MTAGSGESEETIVVAGRIRSEGENLYLVGDGADSPILLPADVLSRLRPISAELRSILLDADYVVMLSVGDLPEEDSPDGYVPMGFRWPL
jgi:hypothetical protein